MAGLPILVLLGFLVSLLQWMSPSPRNTDTMSKPLLPTRFLFRFAAPCMYRKKLWTAKGADLDETFRLAGLTELEGRDTWADVRAAWSEAGLAFTAIVQGKRRPPWCDQSLSESGDTIPVLTK